LAVNGWAPNTITWSTKADPARLRAHRCQPPMMSPNWSRSSTGCYRCAAASADPAAAPSSSPPIAP